MNKKRKCKKCKTLLVKQRDFIRQSGFSYYLECPKCVEEACKRRAAQKLF